jgi:hypothetical protein
VQKNSGLSECNSDTDHTALTRDHKLTTKKVHTLEWRDCFLVYLSLY